MAIRCISANRRFRVILYPVAFFSSLMMIPPDAASPQDVESGVVKISVTQREPDYYRPWSKSGPEPMSGSGAIIEGPKILTNAHVVMHAGQVMVQLRHGGDQLPGKVTAIAPGLDLAVIELNDPSAVEKITPLKLADDLPQPKSRISVYGYPTGGDDLSVTNGIVSRIEFAEYNFDTWGVRIQVDAALNPGNSGGPAIQNGKIAGLVFSKIEQAENIGYLIPPDEIRTFLSDAADGKYEGLPMLYDHFQTAENAALRNYLKIPGKTTGLVVEHAYREDDEYPLKKWDVVTHIGPHKIDNQGYVEVRPGLRMLFLYFVPRLNRDGKIELTILRDGESQVIHVPVAAEREFLVPPLKNSYPEYIICGPLVLTTATREFITNMGNQWRRFMAATDNPALMRYHDRPDEKGDRLVIAVQMFSHPMTQGYSDPPFSVVESFNGTKVKNLRHLAELLRDSSDEFARFTMADRGESLVFRRQEMKDSTEEILNNEGVRFASSEDLRDVWQLP